MPKDDPDIQINQQYNTNNLTEFEAARRVAFALSKAVYADPAMAVEVTPQDACAWQNPTPPREPEPPPEPDPERVRWASELPLTESERADHALVRETRESSLANYAGSPSEQGHGPARSVSPVTRKPTVSERLRQQRARRELL